MVLLSCLPFSDKKQHVFFLKKNTELLWYHILVFNDIQATVLNLTELAYLIHAWILHFSQWTRPEYHFKLLSCMILTEILIWQFCLHYFVNPNLILLLLRRPCSESSIMSPYCGIKKEVLKLPLSLSLLWPMTYTLKPRLPQTLLAQTSRHPHPCRLGIEATQQSERECFVKTVLELSHRNANWRKRAVVC